MKWMMVFLTVAISHVSATVHSQTVTFSGKKAPLEKVFQEIQRQTGYAVFCKAEFLDNARPVSIDVRNEKLEDFLKAVLADQQLSYEMTRTSIVITRGEAAASSKPASPADKGIPAPPAPPAITGRILDPNGGALSGATVRVKGTKRGASTDSKGNFSVQASSGDVLLVSYVGLAEVTLQVTGEEVRILSSSNKEAGESAPQPTISIIGGEWLLRMVEATTKLDEMQVIAYGKTSQRLNTGNIVTIKAADIARSPVSNPILALAGRVPGLNINQVTGYSGAGVTTAIQGQNSIARGNDPFYVVDGVPYPTQQLSITGGVLGQGNINSGAKGSTLSYINPADIESITVLKDADATAIYGSRAANGAILITTKKGRQGKPKVTMDYAHGISRIAKKLKLMNTQEYLAMRRQALQSDGIAARPTDYDVNGFWDTTRYTDWQKELIDRSARYTNLNGAVSGGNGNMQYIIGATFHQETTVVPGKFSDLKGSAHFNINSSTDNNKFQIQLSGSYLVDNNRLPRLDVTNFILMAPTVPALYKADGTLNFAPNGAGVSTFRNPMVDQNNNYNNVTKNLVSNLVIGYTLLPGLNLRSSFGYTDMQSDEFAGLPLTGYAPEDVPYVSRQASYGNFTINNWIIEPQVSYNKTLGAGKLEMLVGGSVQQNHNRGRLVIGRGYNSDNDLENMAAATTLTNGGFTATDYKYAGLFSRLNYVLSDRYILNLSARRDGSSRFGPASRYHSFGAIGAGWIFSQESFVKDHLPALSYGKLRFSYGTTGNDQIGDYLFYELYNQVQVDVPYRGITGLSSSGVYNPLLQWELTKKTNFGLDIGLLKDRLMLNANYFINRSSNQLLSYSLPTLTGVSAVMSNVPATVQNTGLELTLTANLLRKSDFTWTVNANFTLPRNKLIRYDNLDQSSAAASQIIGKSISVSYLFDFAGVNPQTGLYQFRNSKGEITSQLNWETDRTRSVDLMPAWYGGIGTSLTWRGVSLDLLFQLMKRIGSNDYFGYPYPGRFNTNQPTYMKDSWAKPGDQASRQRLTTGFDYAESWGNASLSNIAFTDASYCRLKNLSVAWQLPKSLLRPARLSDVRVYAQGQNLLTFTGYKGLDPETMSSSTLPPLKTWVLGLQIGF